MQIQLKQTEIVAALKQFISQQGISLTGKTVAIAFTAGRKESGITADIDIQDFVIPGFTDAAADLDPVQLSLVSSDPAPVAEPGPADAQDVASIPVQESPAKTVSLFN